MPNNAKISFPTALTALPQWVCWRLEEDGKGRPTKIPYNPKTGRRASSTNPTSWAALELAQEAHNSICITAWAS